MSMPLKINKRTARERTPYIRLWRRTTNIIQWVFDYDFFQNIPQPQRDRTYERCVEHEIRIKHYAADRFPLESLFFIYCFQSLNVVMTIASLLFNPALRFDEAG
jgi:hypothetical protein